MAETKTCTKCDEMKPLSEYFQYKNRRPLSSCKACVSAYKRAYRKANKDQIRERDRAYREANKDRRNEQSRQHRRKNIERNRNNPPSISEQKCSRCGVVKPADAFGRKADTKHGIIAACKACISAAARERYAEDTKYRDRLRAHNRCWQQDNEALLRGYRAGYYRENKEKILARIAAWGRANPEKVRAYTREAGQRRRARRAAAPGIFTGKDIVRIWHRQNGECFWCGVRCGTSPKNTHAYHVDHITPLARGGSNWPRNLCISCPPCNLSKRDKYPAEFRLQAKRLQT